MEELMVDLMYDLPDMDNEGARYVIDAATVEGAKALADLRKAQKESA